MLIATLQPKQYVNKHKLQSKLANINISLVGYEIINYAF